MHKKLHTQTQPKHANLNQPISRCEAFLIAYQRVWKPYGQQDNE